jgi:hypothetical protein
MRNTLAIVFILLCSNISNAFEFELRPLNKEVPDFLTICQKEVRGALDFERCKIAFGPADQSYSECSESDSNCNAYSYSLEYEEALRSGLRKSLNATTHYKRLVAQQVDHIKKINASSLSREKQLFTRVKAEQSKNKLAALGGLLMSLFGFIIGRQTK